MIPIAGSEKEPDGNSELINPKLLFSTHFPPKHNVSYPIDP